MNPNFHDFLLKFNKPKKPVDRVATLVWLETHGVSVPEFGLISNLQNNNKPTDQFVVWLASGTYKMALEEASKYPNDYAVKFVGNDTVAETFKYVQIGSNGYWINIRSADNWMSNKGETKSSVGKIQMSYHPVIELPFFSIDYCKTDKLYAIDFDYEPKLRGYGLEAFVTAYEFRRLYREAERHFSRKNSKTPTKNELLLYDIRNRLVDFPDIKFFVDGNSVVLSGMVDTVQQRNKLYEIMANVENVKKVFASGVMCKQTSVQAN